MDIRADVTIAKRIIALAERDLGKLSAGQRRDLLMDNLDWSSERVARAVAAIA